MGTSHKDILMVMMMMIVTLMRIILLPRQLLQKNCHVSGVILGLVAFKIKRHSFTPLGKLMGALVPSNDNH